MKVQIPRQWQIIFWLILGIHILFSIPSWHYVLTSVIKPEAYFSHDFGAYYVAAAALNSADPQIYTLAYAEQLSATIPMITHNSPYIYPPFFAVMMRPIALLPHIWAIRLWFILNLGFIAAMVYELLHFARIQVTWRHWAIGMLAALVFPPVYNHLALGQANIMLVWLLLYAYRQSANELPTTAALLGGMAFGATIGIKLFLVVLLPMFAAYGRWRAAGFALLGTLCTLAIGVAGAGWENHLIYLREVAPTLDAIRTFFINHALVPTMYRMFEAVAYSYQYFFMPTAQIAQAEPIGLNPIWKEPLGALAYWLVALSSAAVLGWEWVSGLRQAQRDVRWPLSFAVTTSLLLIPLGWIATMVFLLIPLVLLAFPQSPRQSNWHRFAGLTLLCLLLINFNWPLIAYVSQRPQPFWVLTLTTLGVVIVWLVQASVLWQQAQHNSARRRDSASAALRDIRGN